MPSANKPPATPLALAAPVNCVGLAVVGVAEVIVPFIGGEVGDREATAVVEGLEAEAGALVVGAAPEEELKLAVLGSEVGVSDARVPVRLYAAAQAARDIPCTGQRSRDKDLMGMG